MLQNSVSAEGGDVLLAVGRSDGKERSSSALGLLLIRGAAAPEQMPASLREICRSLDLSSARLLVQSKTANSIVVESSWGSLEISDESRLSIEFDLSNDYVVRLEVWSSQQSAMRDIELKRCFAGLGPFIRSAGEISVALTEHSPIFVHDLAVLKATSKQHIAMALDGEVRDGGTAPIHHTLPSQSILEILGGRTAWNELVQKVQCFGSWTLVVTKTNSVQYWRLQYIPGDDPTILLDLDADPHAASCKFDWLSQGWKLTRAERQVFRLILDGLCTQEIALRRKNSRETSRAQVKSVLRKSGYRTKNSLIAGFWSAYVKSDF